MDITLDQIKKSSRQELNQLKQSIISYLNIRKFSNKCIYLVKLIKKIDYELGKRSFCSLEVTKEANIFIKSDKEIKISGFILSNLNDIPVTCKKYSNSELLNSKRARQATLNQFQNFLTNHSSLISKIVTESCVKTYVEEEQLKETKELLDLNLKENPFFNNNSTSFNYNDYNESKDYKSYMKDYIFNYNFCDNNSKFSNEDKFLFNDDMFFNLSTTGNSEDLYSDNSSIHNSVLFK